MIRLALLALLALVQTQSPNLTVEVGKLASASTNEQRFDALTAMLTARKLAYSVESFSLDKPVGREPRTEGRNIVMTFGEGSEDVVLGAHYDAIRLPDGSLSKGAIDNAASSVVLVRVAEALVSERFQRRVRIVWFDMEELGLLGSRQYLRKHVSDKITSMLNFDINAYGNTILFGPSERPDNAELRRNFVQTCAAESVACVGFPQMPPGDDRSFIRLGIPTLSIGVLPGIETHQLWLAMNAGASSGLAAGTTPLILRTIHTVEDAPEKVSEESMTMMSRFVLSLVRSLERR